MYNLGTGNVPPGTLSILAILLYGRSPFSRFWYKDGFSFHDCGQGTVSIFTIFMFEDWKMGTRSGIHIRKNGIRSGKFFMLGRHIPYKT